MDKSWLVLFISDMGLKLGQVNLGWVAFWAKCDMHMYEPKRMISFYSCVDFVFPCIRVFVNYNFVF